MIEIAFVTLAVVLILTIIRLYFIDRKCHRYEVELFLLKKMSNELINAVEGTVDIVNILKTAFEKEHNIFKEET